jgi:outer membrane protein OmpA-like peptidoglycan-associated protein
VGKRASRSILALIVLLVSLTTQTAYAERFRFSYAAGDKYRILSTVHEDIYVNRRLSHRAEILNRIAATVTAAKDGMGSHKATFQTSTRSVGAPAGRAYQWSREYETVFDRDAEGRYTIGEEYWMPVVRDVPIFPDKDLAVGETWTAEGEEVHDFRDGFGDGTGLAAPYRIPFTASYRYLGERTWKGKSYPVISVNYKIFHESQIAAVGVRPIRVLGASDQMIYWDRELGQPAAYQESFRMIFELSDGNVLEFRGDAEAEVLDAQPMDRAKLAEEIAKDIDKLGIADATVRETDAGVAISLEDIKFRPDSAELLSGEKAKLDRIAQILGRYPDRDILVGGHTALAGTEEGRQKLSEERAAAVADYLVAKGARTSERVVVRGYGATNPLADNTSEEGKKRNRRVEITLLEN